MTAELSTGSSAEVFAGARRSLRALSHSLIRPRKRERSRQEDESLIRQWIRPELGNKRVADLRHADVEKLHRKITAKGVPIRANRAAALLSKMFSLSRRPKRP